MLYCNLKIKQFLQSHHQKLLINFPISQKVSSYVEVCSYYYFYVLFTFYVHNNNMGKRWYHMHVDDTDCTNLISLHPETTAIIRPMVVQGSIEKQWSGNKDKCPKEICIVKKERAGAWWVQCTTCEQWFHQRCIKVSKKTLKNDYYCQICL